MAIIARTGRGTFVEVRGQEKIIRLLKNLEGLAAKAAVRVINKYCLLMVGEMRASIKKNTGNFKPYPRGDKIHWSSPPGSAPNRDTGGLEAGLYVDYANAENKRADIVSNAKYSAALEYGTKYVEARPFMRPAIHKYIGPLYEDLKKAIQDEFKRGRKGT